MEFARQYAADGWRVLATCRDPQNADALDALADNGDVKVFALDVTSQEQIGKLADELQDESIDILINNAGYYGSKGSSLGHIDHDDWIKVLEINTLAPLFVTEAFVEQVARSDKKLIAILTSKMGSLEDNTSGGSYLYRSSKAGVNQIAKSLSIDLAHRNIKVALLHPGWVQTDMGGPNALIDVPTSVTGLRDVLANVTPAQSGAFLAYDGAQIPW